MQCPKKTYFELMDYSALYYETIIKKPMPEKRKGKFIQIRNEEKETEHLVLSPTELSVYHANVVERFCLLKGIGGAYITKNKDRYEVHDPKWAVIGGGIWSINDKERRIVLMDTSGVYGKFDAKHLRKKILETGKLSGYDIIIR